MKPEIKFSLNRLIYINFKFNSKSKFQAKTFVQLLTDLIREANTSIIYNQTNLKKQFFVNNFLINNDQDDTILNPS